MRYLHLLALCFLFTSCRVSQVNVQRGALSGPGTAVVTAKPTYSADARVHIALENELAKRGFAASGKGRRLAVEFADSWQWDIAMYLRVLSLRFTDASSGAPLGSAIWRQTGAHMYWPSQESVVKQIMTALDEKGAFTK